MKTSEQDNVTRLTESTFNRRAFVKGAGFAGAGLAGAVLIAGKLGVMDSLPGSSTLDFKPSLVEAAAIRDMDILNFALNLEYLEAEFYTVATTGKTLEQSGFDLSGSGMYGPTTGGNMVDFTGEMSGALPTIAAQITYDEQEHVKVLRAAIKGLGGTPITKPALKLDALGIGFADFRSFLTLSRAFEDTGASAYGGAAPLIASKFVLGGAVRIGLTEAYHASLVRGLVALNGIATTPVDSKDMIPPPSGTKYFDVDQYGLTVVRTASQVLAIAFNNSTPGTKMGGFFPNGVNGPINTV